MQPLQVQIQFLTSRCMYCKVGRAAIVTVTCITSYSNSNRQAEPAGSRSL